MKTTPLIAIISMFLLFNCVNAERAPLSLNSPGGLLLFLLYAYNGAQFVAAGENGNVYNSYDGKAWHSSSFNYTLSSSMKSVAFNGRRWVAVGNDGNAGSLCGVWHSDDGINWTQGTCPASASPMEVVAYGNGVFLAGGGCQSTIMNMMKSTDGINWSNADYDVGTALGTCSNSSLVYEMSAGNFFLHIGTINHYRKSSDGLNWIILANSPGNPVKFKRGPSGNIIGLDTTTSALYNYNFSADSWSSSATLLGTSPVYHSVAYGGGMYVAVGQSGTPLTSCQISFQSMGFSGTWNGPSNIPNSCTVIGYQLQNVTYNSSLNIFTVSGAPNATTKQFSYSFNGKSWTDGTPFYNNANNIINDIEAAF